MKVFVTGANGYVGSAVVRELARRGHEVTGLVRGASKAAAVESSGAKPLVGNLFDPPAWKDELRACDVVVSATRPVRHGERMSIQESHRRSYNHGRMVGNLLEAASGSRARCMVMTYGVQGFGERGDGWVDENAELRPVGYERTVSGAFWHLEKTSRKCRVPVINMFTGWPYGPGGWFEAMARGIARGTYRTVGEGRNLLSLVHIEDLAAAYAEAVERMPIGNRYSVVDGAPVSQAELASMLAGALGVAPPRWINTDAYVSRASELACEGWTASTRVSGEKLRRKLLPELKHPSVAGSVGALVAGLGLTPPAEGLKEAAGF